MNKMLIYAIDYSILLAGVTACLALASLLVSTVA
jgi:hypothetical protein